MAAGPLLIKPMTNVLRRLLKKDPKKADDIIKENPQLRSQLNAPKLKTAAGVGIGAVGGGSLLDMGLPNQRQVKEREADKKVIEEISLSPVEDPVIASKQDITTPKAAPKATPKATPKQPVSRLDINKSAADIKTGVKKLDKMAKNLPTDLRTEFNQRLDELERKRELALKQAKIEKDNVRWASVFETIGHALTQLGAGLYGMKHNIDMSGLRFNKNDWSKNIDDINRELDTKLEMVGTEEKRVVREEERRLGREERVEREETRKEERKEDIEIRTERDKKRDAQFWAQLNATTQLKKLAMQKAGDKAEERKQVEADKLKLKQKQVIEKELQREKDRILKAFEKLGDAKLKSDEKKAKAAAGMLGAGGADLLAVSVEENDIPFVSDSYNLDAARKHLGQKVEEIDGRIKANRQEAIQTVTPETSPTTSDNQAEKESGDETEKKSDDETKRKRLEELRARKAGK